MNNKKDFTYKLMKDLAYKSMKVFTVSQDTTFEIHISRYRL